MTTSNLARRCRTALILLVVAGCGRGLDDARSARHLPHSRRQEPPSIPDPDDMDGDRLDDAYEAELAERYFPLLAINPTDRCPLHGVVYRAMPHPDDPTLVSIRYSVLYEQDCGFDGHLGDNEAFGVLVDPWLPAPTGILAVRAIAHQNTMCETITSCGQLPGCRPCLEAPRGDKPGYPVVFSSRNKHGNYLTPEACSGGGLLCNIGGRCEIGTKANVPPMVNVGEPQLPLVRDLTEEGFVNAHHGWSEDRLMHFDPWNAAGFGHAGRVGEDVDDPAFLISPTGCND